MLVTNRKERFVSGYYNFVILDNFCHFMVVPEFVNIEKLETRNHQYTTIYYLTVNTNN